jgi:hemerythrin-like metal-binding protein
MRTLQWPTKYDIGIEAIDDDHRELYAVMRDIHDSIETGDLAHTKALTEDFIGLAKAHFAREQEMLLRVRFPDVEEHIRHHAAIIAKARELKAIREDKAGKTEAAHLYDELLSVLLDDIVRGDHYFKSFLETQTCANA